MGGEIRGKILSRVKRFDYRKGSNWTQLTDHLYTQDSELQVITAPPLITVRKLQQHPLSLFQPLISSPAVPWQRLLIMEIPQFRALGFYL
jgi:hypothetical protein